MGPMDTMDTMYPGQLDEIDQQIRNLSQEREHLIKSSTQKPLDAKDEVMVRLAHEAGEMKSMFKAEVEKNKDLQLRLEEQTTRSDRLEGIEAQATVTKF